MSNVGRVKVALKLCAKVKHVKYGVSGLIKNGKRSQKLLGGREYNGGYKNSCKAIWAAKKYQDHRTPGVRWLVAYLSPT